MDALPSQFPKDLLPYEQNVDTLPSRFVWDSVLYRQSVEALSNDSHRIRCPTLTNSIGFDALPAERG